MGPRYDVSVSTVLPPAFVCFLITTLWSSYTFLHLLPQLHFEHGQVSSRGLFETVIFQVLFALLLISYARAMFTLPGDVPEEWLLVPAEVEAYANVATALTTQEVKFSGARRRCKHCQIWKPDRCHHCRICQACILKMDHHCPWIMNCIGFRNHKYFLLSVIYGLSSCIFMAITVLDTVTESMHKELHNLERYLLVQIFSISSLLCCMLSVFLGFHFWLLLSGFTTIEFCEKTATGSRESRYSIGFWGNLKATLGPRPYLWLLPVNPPDGDGISFTRTLRAASGFYGGGLTAERNDPEWTAGNESPVHNQPVLKPTQAP